MDSNGASLHLALVDDYGDDVVTHPGIKGANLVRTGVHLRRGRQVVEVRLSGALQTSEPMVAQQAALRGVGIAVLPTQLVSAELAACSLVHVFPEHEYKPEALGIHAVCLSRQYRPRLLRSGQFAERFGDDAAPWDRTAHSRSE